MNEDLDTLKKKLAESEKHVQQLQSQVDELIDFVENASVPLHWVNGSGIIIWVNKAELDLLGYKKEEYVNKHISNFHADQHVIEDILERLRNKQTLRNVPARLKCKNGDIKHVLINSNVLWKGDAFIHTRCFTRDITDQKMELDKKDQLLQSLLEKKSDRV